MDKKYQADPIKLYLSARSYATAWAKDLCVAGKIELSQIPDYTDRMTVLQYGQMSTDPKVDAEIMRIAARIHKRALESTDTAMDPHAEDQSYCASCVNDCKTGGPLTSCDNYYSVDDAEADAELRRQQEEEERQAAEAEAQEPVDTTPSEEPVVYNCGTCGGKWKTLKGMENHKCKGKK
jgi:hypothetical protein